MKSLALRGNRHQRWCPCLYKRTPNPDTWSWPPGLSLHLFIQYLVTAACPASNRSQMSVLVALTLHLEGWGSLMSWRLVWATEWSLVSKCKNTKTKQKNQSKPRQRPLPSWRLDSNEQIVRVKSTKALYSEGNTSIPNSTRGTLILLPLGLA